MGIVGVIMIKSAIAECQGKRNPDARTCIMLAAFLTIKRELFVEEKDDGYSFAPAPIRNTVDIGSGSAFARAVNGMNLDEFIPIMDELMDTLQIVQPRLYSAVMSKLS